MPTWNELKQYARSKYKLSNDEEEWFAVVFAEKDKRSQKIVVRKFTAFNKEWIEFRTPVCKQEEMSPVVALRKNAEMAIGSLAIMNDVYYLLHNAPLDSLDPGEFELPLEFLSTKADELEKQYSAGNDLY